MNGNAPRRMADVRLGKDACFDAWLYNLFIDNNLVHDLNPHIVASPEQLKFMVAAWSSFSGQRWLLLGVTGVIVLAVLWLLARRIVRHPLGICACCLILSGGIGNIIDRLRLGYVVDMLHFQFWPSYPTFNVADMCIVSGAVLGAVYYIWIYEKHDRRKSDGAADPTGGQ